MGTYLLQPPHRLLEIESSYSDSRVSQACRFSIQSLIRSPPPSALLFTQGVWGGISSLSASDQIHPLDRLTTTLAFEIIHGSLYASGTSALKGPQVVPFDVGNTLIKLFHFLHEAVVSSSSSSSSAVFDRCRHHQLSLSQSGSPSVDAVV
jgi:hypothetical protein